MPLLSGFSTGVEIMGGSLQNIMGSLSQYMDGAWGGAKNAVEKHLWRESFDSKVAGYKPASLQIY